MAWKPTLKNLVDYRHALEGARDAVSKAREELRDYTVLSDAVIEESLPYIPENGELWKFTNRTGLSDRFTNRRDFETELRYLQRVERAGTESPTKTSVSLVPDNPTKLTSFYLDENRQPTITVWQRQEESIIRQRQNRDALKRLEDQYGVEMVRTPLKREVDGELKNVYDESRHIQYTYVPKTPKSQEKYWEAISADPSLKIQTPDTMVDDVQVDIMGDMVPLKKQRRHYERKREREIRERWEETMNNRDEKRQRSLDDIYERQSEIDNITDEITSLYGELDSLDEDELERFEGHLRDDIERLEFERNTLQEMLETAKDFYRFDFGEDVDTYDFGDGDETYDFRDVPSYREQMQEEKRRRFEAVYHAGEHRYRTNMLYFENFRDIMKTTLPKTISEELDMYIDYIEGDNERLEAFYQQMKVHRAIGVDVGDLEFLYLDRSMAMSSKVTTIVNWFRDNVQPFLGNDVPDEYMGTIEEDRVTEIMAQAAMTGAVDIAGAYHNAKGLTRGKKVGVTMQDLADEFGWNNYKK